MTRLKYLNVVGSPIDDAGLKPVGAFRSLELLELGHTRITDHGLAAISRLPVLGALDLDRTQIGDSGLNLLCDFPAITQLRLTHTDVTDSGLAAVADKLNAGTCWILGISGVRLTGAGMKSLSERLTHTQLIGDGRVYHIGPRATVNRKPTVVDEEMPQ
jgi:hypothetical protein